METLLSHFSSLPRTSEQASVLILLVLAVQWVCGRRLQPRWRCALWLLVLARLALPWTIPSPASVFNILRVPAAVLTVGAGRGVEPQTGRAPITEAPPSKPEGAAIQPWSGGTIWLVCSWAAGALTLAGCAAANHYKICRRVARRHPFMDEPTLNLLEDCKALMGIEAGIAIIETGAVQSPTLFGFVRPRLLFPMGLASSFSRAELRHVFLHELAHIKRRDILVGWLTLALQVIHWFNPLVWLAFYRLRADRELACDALALSFAAAGEKESYGLAGILENKRQMKERITMIAKFNKANRGLTAAICLLAGLGVVTLTDAQNQTRPPVDNSEPDASKGVWVVRLEPIGDFAPKSPGEFLQRASQSGAYSGEKGQIGYFRTKKQGDKLIGSFLAYDPDQLKAALAKVPGLKVTSVEKLTQEQLAAYEKLPQESL
jgi:bla regulator protein BlaR1